MDKVKAFELEGEVGVRLRGSRGAEFLGDLEVFLKDPSCWRRTDSGFVIPAWQDPPQAQEFLQAAYNEMGFKGSRLVVPAVSRLTKKQIASLRRFRMGLFFIPSIGEDEYPDNFIKPVWGKYLDSSKIERRQLPGRWVAVETISKCDWNDPQGYGNGEDPIAVALKIATRFKISWDDHHASRGTLARFAKASGFPKKSTRFGTAEEWNFLGNVFNWLREHRGADLPNLVSTNSWEWCENLYGSALRLVCGVRGSGGLGAVHRSWHGSPSDDVAFRVLAQF